MKPQIKICEITSSENPYLESCLDLMNRTQGVGLFDADYLIRKIESPESIVLMGTIEDELVSVGCADILDDLEYYRSFDPNIQIRLAGKKIGSFSTLSVVEKLQGQGIGQRMSRARIEWLQKKQCDTILGVSWVSGLGHTSDRVFGKMGFHAVAKIDQFYYEEAKENPFQCPGCNQQPCICAAILYERSLITI